MPHQKKDRRLAAIQGRQALSPADRRAADAAIVSKLRRLPLWRDVSRVHIYLPSTRMNEPDTWSLLRWIWDSGKALVYSPLMVRPGAVVSAEVRPDTRFDANTFGIPVPCGMEPARHLQFDVIVVPMLGFTSNGDRLGYGGGWYDRLLSVQTKAIKIGLAYEVTRQIDLAWVEPHDQPVDLIVTELNNYGRMTDN